MMIRLICLGLWVAPFIFVNKINIYEIKEITAIGISLALGILALYLGEVKKFENKWVLLFVFWGIINIFLAPKFFVEMAGIEASSFWVWKPLATGLCYLMGIIAVSSVDITRADMDSIYRVFVYSALIMGIYMILQYFNCDQFFKLSGDRAVKYVPNVRVSGFLAHPTFAGAYMAICIPFIIRSRKWVILAICVVALLLTKSHMAIGASILSTIFLIGLIFDKFKAVFISLCVIFCIGMCVPSVRTATIDTVKSNSSGRIAVWQGAITDWKASPMEGETKRTITGLGPGSFRYVFGRKSTFRSAHNEPLEILYSYGLIGLGLFIMALWKTLYGNRGDIYVIGSFICLLILCFGLHVLQHGATALVAVVLFGLLNNKNFAGGNYASRT